MDSPRLFATAVAVLLFTIGPAFGPAQARETLSDDQLADERGGVLVADGVTFDFGAVVRAFEDGKLSLETQVNWTPDGPQVSRLAGEGVTPLPAEAMKALRGLGEAFRTPSGAAVAQNVTEGQIINLLANTSSSHDFRLDTQITLILPGFAATQASISRQVLGLKLADDFRAGLAFLN